MKSITTLLYPSFISVFLFFFTSCGSSPASVMDEMVTEMNTMVTILEGIDSQEDFDAAKEDLDASQAKLKELGEQLNDLDASDEDKKKLSEEYGPKLLEASMALATASIKASAYGFSLESPDGGL
jgi:hypothetical protein